MNKSVTGALPFCYRESRDIGSVCSESLITRRGDDGTRTHDPLLEYAQTWTVANDGGRLCPIRVGSRTMADGGERQRMSDRCSIAA